MKFKRLLISSILLGLNMHSMAQDIENTSINSSTTTQNASANNLSSSTPTQNTLHNLYFDPTKGVKKSMNYEGKEIKFRAFEQLIYVEKPIDTQYESMNIYIPEAYFEDQSINGFNKDTAPIFMQNNVGGYMPALPGTIENKPMGAEPPATQTASSPTSSNNTLSSNNQADSNTSPRTSSPTSTNSNVSPSASTHNDPSSTNHSQNATQPQTPPNMDHPNTLLAALAQGYVVVSPGARGRTQSYGKAPAAIVDLKAAVRYLKFNDERMQGDAQKIIINGTSAGGALSALMGASGNQPDYQPYLDDIGAEPLSKTIMYSRYRPIVPLPILNTLTWPMNGSLTASTLIKKCPFLC
ncbi:alpha/beta hydrolase [Basilea psittacipulmonis]|uniref:alpha/beta hydrolase n=1 Tax=Basilea psittacipulmonis TaxID=1472345 RepID=UPI00068B4B63|nr:alpha/beta hydrolase [Basilea psittacipulmonis]